MPLFGVKSKIGSAPVPLTINFHFLNVYMKTYEVFFFSCVGQGLHFGKTWGSNSALASRYRGSAANKSKMLCPLPHHSACNTLKGKKYSNVHYKMFSR